MSAWRVLVTVHNLVNIPPTACEDPERRFTVEVRQVNVGGSGLPPQRTPTSTFTAREVTESTPKVFEIRLDAPQRGHARSGCACVWRCSKDTVDVVVEVREGDRVVGSSTTFQVNVKKVVLDAKLTTRIIGTEMGQVGVSFSVDPEDRDGYKGRLESFLREYNPKGLHLVQNVVEVVPEVDTFTKLYRKYRLRDYDKRLREFFAMYGPEYTQDIPSLVKQWESREEELMRNLILDNGPEMCDVDVNQRLTAFLTQYRLQRSDPNVAQILNNHRDDAVDLLAALTDRYGAEPDPRNYIFPATHYVPLSLAGQSRSPPPKESSSPWKASPTPLRPPPRPTPAPSLTSRSRRHTNTTTLTDPGNRSYLSLLGASPSRSPENAWAKSHTGMAGTGMADQHGETVRGAPRGEHGAVSPRADGGTTLRNGGRARQDGFYGDAVFDDTNAEDGRAARVSPSPAQRQQRSDPIGRDEQRHEAMLGGTGAAARSRLWLRMSTMLRTSGQRHALQPGFFYYCSAERFRELVDSLDAFSKEERTVLEEEWSQMCRSAVEEASMDQSSPGFDGALAEAAQAAGLQAVQLQVTGMTSFLHREQYKYFHARLASAKEPKVERLVLVGDYQKLLRVARHGVLEARGDDGTQPAAVFSRNPFAQWKQAKTTCLLVCDVVIGRSHKSSPPALLPHNGTKAFLEQYDSSVFFSGTAADTGSPNVAVYDARQVLPHLLVQCTVDPALTPCPSHPNRAGEYYVLDDNVVACSRCVVMGRYKGREVLPIEEAATQARGRLAEMRRAAESVDEAMVSFGKQLRKEEAMMPSAPRRLEAQREVERIRREADERIAKILATVEQQDKAQQDRIRADLHEMEAVRVSAQELARELDESRAGASPLAVVQALQQAKHDRALESLLARAQERIPRAPLGKVHPLRGEDGEAGTPTATDDVKRIAMSPGAGVATRGGASPMQGPSSSSTRNHYSINSAYVETPPKLPAPPQPRVVHSSSFAASVSGPRDDMYSRYQSISPGIEAQETLRTRRPPTPHQAQSKKMPSRDATAEAAPAALAVVDAPSKTTTNPKESLTKGWAFLHNGDERGAAAEWGKVKEAYGEDDVPGAKARAYLAEAIDKDYETAAAWYAHCLQLDPKDRLTAYNYGVLLEALLQRPQDAVVMYDRAAALGDHVAAARAEQLRAVNASTHSHAA